MAIKKLLFVDTNIWLDFYRARTEAGLALLKHLEKVADKVIVTYQLEMEFKKNRHAAMLEGMQDLKTPQGMARPGLFSDAKAVKAIAKSQKVAAAQAKNLRTRYLKALENPTTGDPVYKIVQRIFRKEDALVLTRDNPIRRLNRRKALRRFLLGCPPRKKNDTSMGDAVNWEWMIECAISQNAELVIVSRDSDYGVVFDDAAYINDHLRQEFSERVSKKRKILLYNKLSDALKHFKIAVTEEEKREEKEVLAPALGAEHFDIDRLLDGPGMLGRASIPAAQYLEKIAAVRTRIDELFNSPETKEAMEKFAASTAAIKESIAKFSERYPEVFGKGTLPPPAEDKDQ